MRASWVRRRSPSRLAPRYSRAAYRLLGRARRLVMAMAVVLIRCATPPAPCQVRLYPRGRSIRWPGVDGHRPLCPDARTWPGMRAESGLRRIYVPRCSQRAARPSRLRGRLAVAPVANSRLAGSRARRRPLQSRGTPSAARKYAVARPAYVPDDSSRHGLAGMTQAAACYVATMLFVERRADPVDRQYRPSTPAPPTFLSSWKNRSSGSYSSPP